MQRGSGKEEDMSRAKKKARDLHLYVDEKVCDRFERYCEEMGQPKTVAFERIVVAYLDGIDKGRTDSDEIKTNKTV